MSNRHPFTISRLLALAGLASICFALSMCIEFQKNVAIVLDDGPSPEHTEAFLEIFAEQNIRVSFALIGENVAKHPHLAKAISDAGHEIVNHSYSHAHPEPLSDAALEQEIVGGQTAIVAGAESTPKWYWPPYGEFDDRMESLFEKAKITAYAPRGFVSSDDWNQEVDADEIYSRATKEITDGCVIVFHEWRAETLQQMPSILAELKRQNCQFFTFSELASIVD